MYHAIDGAAIGLPSDIMQPRDHLERQRAAAVEHLMDAIAAADEGNEVARLKSVLVQMVFDRFHRVREVHRVVPALPCLD